MKAEAIRSVASSSVTMDRFPAWGKTDGLSMLRSEVDMLVAEDIQLLKIAGAAALFVSQLQGVALPAGALAAASKLARLIGEIPEDAMCDALEMLQH